MGDVLQEVRNEPEILFRGHPVAPVESGKVDGRPRISPERLFPAQVEVGLEVRKRELAQRSKDRFSKAEAGVIRPSDRAPMPVLPEEREDVVVVLHGFEIENQRRVALEPEGGGGKHCAVHALDHPFPQHAAGGAAVGSLRVIVELVEIFLDLPGRIETPQKPRLPARHLKVVHRLGSVN